MISTTYVSSPLTCCCGNSRSIIQTSTPEFLTEEELMLFWYFIGSAYKNCAKCSGPCYTLHILVSGRNPIDYQGPYCLGCLEEMCRSAYLTDVPILSVTLDAKKGALLGKAVARYKEGALEAPTISKLVDWLLAD